MYFSRLLFGIIFSTLIGTAVAAEYKSVVPYAPGSMTDVTARTIQSVFARNTKDTLIVENIPGGDTIIGTMHYKNNADRTIMFTTSPQMVFNFVLKDNLPYSQNDFNDIIYLGTTPGIWLVRADSDIRTPEDLVTKMPPFVGYHAVSYASNITVMQKEKGVRTQGVPFKASNDVMLAVMSKTIDIGMTSITPAIIENIKAGKIRIVGTSYKEDIVLDGISLLSVPKRLGIIHFHGTLGIALKPGLDPATTEYLRRELWRASTDPETVNRLKSLFVITNMTNNAQEIQKEYQQYRELAKKYLFKQ
jgi:tripartite-type tricarboxylate transporter receptor subunit TctC